jgi:hypothetical protein
VLLAAVAVDSFRSVLWDYWINNVTRRHGICTAHCNNRGGRAGAPPAAHFSAVPEFQIPIPNGLLKTYMVERKLPAAQSKTDGMYHKVSTEWRQE